MTGTAGADSRTVLVTGAGQNIGADVARRFAAKGNRVVLNARRPDDIGRVAKEIVSQGGEAMSVTGNICDPNQVAALLLQVQDRYGGVDVLINNAMTRRHMPIEATSLEDWRAVLEVVLTGSFNCTKAVLPHMRHKGWGRIISLGGVAGQMGARDRVAVVTAKSGLFGFTKAVALETARQGITANVLSPGIIETDRRDLAEMGDAAAARAHYETETASIPVGRRGHLEEISAACLFLASDAAAFITGQVIGVNGGRHM